MQPIEFLEHAKQYIDYADRSKIAEYSNLNINKIYRLLNDGTGKKNALNISRAVLKLLSEKNIKDVVIKNYSKKFA